MLDLLKTLSKGWRIIRKSWAFMQDITPGTLRAKEARDSRKQHKRRRRQLLWGYSGRRKRRIGAVERPVVDKLPILSITRRRRVIDIDPTTILPKRTPEFDGYTCHLRKLGLQSTFGRALEVVKFTQDRLYHFALIRFGRNGGGWS